MSALAELQRDLQAFVLQRDASGPGDATRAVAAIVASPAADATQRLGIYAHGYRARLLEILRNDFPGLRALAGADAFERLCLGYVEATPSPYYNVRWYGDRLAAFARMQSPWSAQSALAEMAAFEWNIGLAFDAAAQPIVAAAEVAAVAPQDWPRLCLRLHPSLRRIVLSWNVSAIRRAVDRAEAMPPLQACSPAQSWIVWRKDLTVRYRRLEDDEAAALDAVAQGGSFAQLCTVLCEWRPLDAVAARAATFFRQWIEDQWVTALDLAES